MALTQKTRTIRLGTALGEDAVGLRGMVLRETLGQPFVLDIEAVAEATMVDLDKLIGTNLTVSIETADPNAPRHVNAYVTEASITEDLGRWYRLHIVAAPWIALLGLAQGCRIFENKTAVEIVEAVLNHHALGPFRQSLSRSYPSLRYCVQYNETDLAFVSRLLEREGIYWHVEHDNGRHEVVLADAAAGLEPAPGCETLPFRPSTVGDSNVTQAITDWRPRRSLQPTRVLLRDYSPERPRADMDAESTIARSHAASGFEIYEYPGGYALRDDGVSRARTRIEALQARHDLFEAVTTARGLRTGAAFELSDHPREAWNGRYYVIESETVATAPDYRTGEEGEESVMTRLVAAPLKAEFRPPRRTPWPRIAGTQTAVVTGPDGDELHPSDYLGVKVAFHWLPGVPSCWVRTSQAWTGDGWGAMSIPRIGEEVVVAFEEGDPDRPLIVGRLYNAVSKPPYDPVGMATVTSFKTASSKGGGGFNELRFEDRKGSENVFLHAQKDHDLRVTEKMRQSIGDDVHVTMEKNAHLKIAADRHEKIEGDSTHEVVQNLGLKVGADTLVEIGGALGLTVKGDALAKVTGAVGVTAGTELLLDAGSEAVLVARTAIHLKAGTTLVLEAGAQLSLKVGGSFVDIGPAGVSIKGPTVLINSGGAAASGSGKTPGEPTKPPAPKPPDPAITAKGGKPAPKPAERPRVFTAVELDSHPSAAALRAAHQSGAPFCEQCARAAAGGQA